MARPVDPILAGMSRHLVGLSTSIRLRMSEGLLARGHDLRPATAQLIPNLPAEGLRSTELASRLRLTLQRTGQLVNELVDLGYLERLPDPSDGRARIVVLAKRGERLVEDIDEIMRDITREFSETLGAGRLRDLCGLLAELDIALHGDDAPVRVLSRMGT